MVCINTLGQWSPYFENRSCLHIYPSSPQTREREKERERPETKQLKSLKPDTQTQTLCSPGPFLLPVIAYLFNTFTHKQAATHTHAHSHLNQQTHV